MSRAELRARLAQLEARRIALECRRLAILEERCAAYPDPEETHRELIRLEQLLDLRQALSLEQALLAPAPDGWEPPAVFRDQTPEEALSGARLEYGIWAQDSQKRPFPWHWLVLMLAGVAALWIPHWIGKALGVAALLAGTVLFASAQAHRKRTAETVRALESRYSPLPPDRWIAAAEEYAQHTAQRQAADRATIPERQALVKRLGELDREIQAITGNRTPEAALARLREAVSDHADLSQARRECRSASGTIPDPALDALSLEETLRQLAECGARQRELRQELNRAE